MVWLEWPGYEGCWREAANAAGIHVQPVGNVTLATLDLSREDHEACHLGYANDVLCPCSTIVWISRTSIRVSRPVTEPAVRAEAAAPAQA
jgi:hypothetical protein